MDINATSLFAQQQALGQLQAGQTAIKNAAKQELQTATIISNAIEAAASTTGSGRGQNLDITV